MGVVEDLQRAREAYERRDWVSAYERLSDIDGQELHTDDFAHLASAAYLTGRTNDCVQALQRAYQLHLDRKKPLAAAECALWLAQVLLFTGELAVASGWIARGQRLLDEEPDDVVQQGHLQLLLMFRHVVAGEFADAAGCARRAADFGRRFGDADLIAMGLSTEGRFALHTGRVTAGIALLDESMVGVAAGAVSEIYAGAVYCSMIEACQEISDFSRAVQWTEALTHWCADQPGLIPYTGQCAVHRGQIMRLRGSFHDALEEFSFAAARYLVAGTPFAAGLAYAERGDVLRTLGRFDDADESYTQAREYGLDPQPGLALLWLARGKSASAAGAVRRLLAEPRDAVGRSQVLPAAVEVLLAAEDFAEAEELCDEFGATAADFGCGGLRAMAAYASGSVALARGEAGRAITELRRAAREWADLVCPYEAARCGLLIGRALARTRRRGIGGRRTGAGAAGLRRAGRCATSAGGLCVAEDVCAERAQRARGRGAASRRGRTEQRRDRGGARAQREDGRSPPVQHLHQDRRRFAHRRSGIRVRTRSYVSVSGRVGLGTGGTRCPAARTATNRPINARPAASRPR